MKRLLIAACAAIALASPLASCATKPIIPAQSEMLIAQVETGFEMTYNAAAAHYLAKVHDGSLTGVRKAQAKAAFQTWRRAVLAIRTAERLGNASDVASQTTAILDLAAKATAFLN